MCVRTSLFKWLLIINHTQADNNNNQKKMWRAGEKTDGVAKVRGGRKEEIGNAHFIIDTSGCCRTNNARASDSVRDSQAAFFHQ